MNPVEQFYKNSTILVTGGSGFMGSVLVEKLLRCFDVKRIFVLMRAKYNQSVEERARTFFDKEIFSEIKSRSDGILQRVTFVEVNFDFDDMKIEKTILAEIQSKVEIVFNVMATVRFDEPIKHAVNINMLATRKIINLSRQMTSLKSFLHVSTLYTNSDKVEDSVIDEKIYHQVCDYKQIISYSKISNSMQIEYLHTNFHNTYTLTKHFAEKLVITEVDKLPTAIFRPPIVASSYEDHPGYKENLNGTEVITFAIEKRHLRFLNFDKSKDSNAIPVDYCINAMIVVAWETHTTKNLDDEIPIYNYIFKENNLKLGTFFKRAGEGSKSSLWSLSYFMIASRCLYNVFDFCFHLIPAFLLDFFMSTSQHMTFYHKMNKMIDFYYPFLTKQWNFKNENTLKLIEKTKSFTYQDGTLMEFDARKINWTKYFETYLNGILNCSDLIEMNRRNRIENEKKKE